MPKGNPLSQLSKEALSNFLNQQDWSLYSTHTTAYELTLPSARRSMERLFVRVSDWMPDVKLFWVAEPFDLKEGFHTHSLWQFPSEIWQGDTKNIYKRFVDDWKVVSKTNDARVYSERYKKDWGAHGYLSKYLQKYNSDYDYLDKQSVNKEFMSKNVQTIKSIGRKASAKRKIEKYCKENNVTIEELKKKYASNKISQREIEKIKRELQ